MTIICHNKCVFCFIDQLPPGMRETMYFKDDDARLSFLQGNYITMTNMKDKDFRRIIEYKLSPINISIHTMNMELRKAMLHNRFADKLIDYMDQLYAAGITMNGQIVLCKGIMIKRNWIFIRECINMHHIFRVYPLSPLVCPNIETIWKS